MAGYRPGPGGRRDPWDPGGPWDQRGPHDAHDPYRDARTPQPRRTLGPYGPRDDGEWPAAGYDRPVHGAPRPYAPAARRPPGRVATPPWERPAHRAPARREPTGGAAGNERLTALTGAVLLALFAAEGVTILAIHQLITAHFFLGMLLIGPVALKAGAVCYRFARYYTGAPQYRRKGPPAPLLRLLGPFVLIFSIGVIGTGVMLGVTGSGQPWLFLHKAFFVLWFGVMTIHVLAYAWRLPRLIGSDLGSARLHRSREIVAGRGVRWLLLAASLAGGLIIAFMTVHLAGPWTSWQHFGG